MKTNSFIRLALFVFAFVAVFSQVRGQTTQPTPDTDVVKITTKLVQLDVLVTDKDGRQVKGLKAQDFEVFQDGKPQKITNLTYIDRAPQTTERISTVISNSQAANTVPPPRITPAEARRIITFVVDDDPDDCQLKVADISSVRVGIEKFVREQMESTDLVAIYRTRLGSGLLQQYTNDKNLLLKIARGIKYTLPPPYCLSPDKPLSEIGMYRSGGSNWFSIVPASYSPIPQPTPPAQKPLYGNVYDKINSKLGVLRYANNGLSKLQGRKTVIVLSHNMPVVSEEKNILLDNVSVLSDLIEYANRSSVAIYTVYTPGINIPMVEARDYISGVKSNVGSTDGL